MCFPGRKTAVLICVSDDNSKMFVHSTDFNRLTQENHGKTIATINIVESLVFVNRLGNIVNCD